MGKNTIAGSSRGGQSSHRQRGTHVCRVLPICFTMLNSRSRIRPRPASPRSPCRDCSTSGTAHDRPPHAPFACKLFWRLFILISLFFVFKARAGRPFPRQRKCGQCFWRHLHRPRVCGMPAAFLRRPLLRASHLLFQISATSRCLFRRIIRLPPLAFGRSTVQVCGLIRNVR